MNILVTGGAGYVGSHAVRRLVSAGHRVVVYDNLVNGHRAAVPAGSLIVGDILDRARLTEVLSSQHIDAVMHFAAISLVGESVTDPAKYYHNNVTGALTLLDAMRTSGVSRIVFSSTTATYGNPTSIPIPEETPQHPVSPYGFTKLAIEWALADYARAYGLGYAALRYFNAAGADPAGDLGEDHRPETHLIPIVLEAALGKRSHVTLFGDDYPTADGTCIRDYVHVSDLADAHLSALERLEPGRGLLLNLGTGHGYSVRQVIDACRRITGRPIEVKMGSRRSGDAAELVADARRAKRVLDWKPRYDDLDAIISTAWRWHSTHPQGYCEMAVRTAPSAAPVLGLLPTIDMPQSDGTTVS